MPCNNLLFPLLLFPALLFFFLFLKTKTIFSKCNHSRLPPGPWTLPAIGSAHHLIGRGVLHHAFCSLSRRYGHLMFLQLGELPTVVASSREAAREIMKTHDLKFCTRPVIPTAKILSFDRKDILFSPYGEYWREMKKICVLKALSSKRVESFRSIREEEINGLIQRISSLSSARQFFNLSEQLFVLANDVTARAIIGSKSKDQDLLIRVIKKAFKVVGDSNVTNMFPSSRLIGMLTGDVRRAEHCNRSVAQMLENIIRERRKQEDGDAEDLLMVFLRLHDKNSENNLLCMDSIKAIIFELLAGGTDTSGTTLGWAMAELMKNPRVMKKAQTELRQQLEGHKNITESDLNELNFIHFIIKETLRLHPPVPLLAARECQETCNILGYDIPKGTIVFVNAWAIGRDPNNWKDAEEFKPERFSGVNNSDMQAYGGDFESIPFGGGRRTCPGMLFGLATVKLALANLLYHFDWELPHGMYSDELDMTETFAGTASRKSPLCLRALPYKC